MTRAKFTTNLNIDTLKKLNNMATINGLNINQVIEIIVKKQKKLILI